MYWYTIAHIDKHGTIISHPTTRYLSEGGAVKHATARMRETGETYRVYWRNDDGAMETAATIYGHGRMQAFYNEVDRLMAEEGMSDAEAVHTVMAARR